MTSGRTWFARLLVRAARRLDPDVGSTSASRATTARYLPHDEWAARMRAAEPDSMRELRARFPTFSVGDRVRVHWRDDRLPAPGTVTWFDALTPWVVQVEIDTIEAPQKRWDVESTLVERIEATSTATG